MHNRDPFRVIRNRFMGAFSRSSSSPPDTQPVVNDWYDNLWGEPSEVTTASLVDAYRTSPMLRSTVDTHVAYTVGAGYHITVTPSRRGGASQARIDDALDLLESAADAANLRAKNGEIATAAWLSGNWFGSAFGAQVAAAPAAAAAGPGEGVGAATGPRIRTSGMTTVPQATITGIQRDAAGATEYYIQVPERVGSPLRFIPAAHMLHFARGRVDGSAWGEGLGQLFCRRGSSAGYKNSAGRTVRRPSLQQVEEMILDVSTRVYYAAQPRYAVYVDDHDRARRAELARTLDRLDPLKHIVLSNQDGKARMDPVSLATQGKYGDILGLIQTYMVMALQNPLIQLWTTQNFAYASSESAMAALLPLIKSYEYDHARFIEQHFLRPVIEEAMGPGAWHTMDVRLRWGDPQSVDLDAIFKLIDSRRLSRDLVELIPGMDVVSMLQEHGYKIDPPTEQELARIKEDRMRAMPPEMRRQASPGQQQQQPPAPDTADMAAAERIVENMYRASESAAVRARRDRIVDGLLASLPSAPAPPAERDK